MGSAAALRVQYVLLFNGKSLQNNVTKNGSE